LNEAREKLETMIYCFCKCYGLKLPRRYRKRARKEYLAFAKSRKHKVKAPVEFGAKFDLSLDSEGYGRIEKISFEAYIPDQGNQELLQGTWNPVIRSKAGQTKRYNKS